MTGPNGKVIAFPGKRARRQMQTAAPTGFRDKLAAFVIKAFSTPLPAIWLCSPSCCVCLSAPQAETLEVN
jgi:hypothetical protein